MMGGSYRNVNMAVNVNVKLSRLGGALLSPGSSLSRCLGHRLYHSISSRKCWSPQYLITRGHRLGSNGQLQYISLSQLHNLAHARCAASARPLAGLLARCQLTKAKPQFVLLRGMASKDSQEAKADRTSLIYICAIGIFMVGAAYAGVPLYRIFCQATGRGGQAVVGHDTSKVATMEPVKDRTITVTFNADVASSMRWNFRPQQSQIQVLPGETALAFYTAKNPTDAPIIGISTYNVIPFEAGQYFNKIQCFCFEEQRLNPHEQVDMPVFFYIDPDFASDPKLATVDKITLSYTFFEAKEGLNLPLPGYVQPTPQPQT